MDRALQMVMAAADLARAGDTDGLRELLDAGVPLEIRTAKGDSLVMLASYNGHLATTAMLLGRGADPSALNDRGQHPLAGAAFKGDLDMVRLLLEHGAKADQPCAGGQTALAFAEMFERHEVAAVLRAA